MAKLNTGVSPTSVIIRVKLLNSSVTTGAGLTGLTSASTGLIIGTIKIGEATTTAYTQSGGTIETIAALGTYAAPTATKCRFKEVDATNHPGVYEIQLADARFASTDNLIISIHGASNLAQCDVEIQCTNLSSNLIQIAGAAVATGTAQLGVNVVSEDNIDFGALKKTSINDEVKDVINTDTSAEPSQGTPSATTDLRTKIDYVYMKVRNEERVTASEIAVYNDAGDTKVIKASVSDNGTTFTKGKFGTGA